MVTNNQAWEEQTRRFLAEKQSQKATIEKQLNDLQQQHQAISKEVEAYGIILQDYLKRSGRPDIDVDWNTLLTNARTHKERIKVIAEHYGVVRPVQLTDILYPKFISSKSRTNAYQIVQMNLADMVDASIMEKSNGEYRLIGGQHRLAVD